MIIKKFDKILNTLEIYFLCVVNYETSESCQIMFLHVIFGFLPL